MNDVKPPTGKEIVNLVMTAAGDPAQYSSNDEFRRLMLVVNAAMLRELNSISYLLNNPKEPRK